ncbi:putative lipoprotein [Escherichia coli]|uniref:Putative lipoprotein n=1 Tax=Escherichia coli TaxID=562 RepID=A0A377K4F7_ECOLX|nr:putative lipoprotein [Escherichia coli]
MKFKKCLLPVAMLASFTLAGCSQMLMIMPPMFIKPIN